MEPYGTENDIVDLSENIICIVPGLTFDLNGYRLGYGGGYYDRFLCENNRLITVGLCYQNNLTDKLIINQYDMPVNYIITETPWRYVMEKNEKNKILEDILNQTNQKQSKSSVSGKRYEQHIPRKNVNPAALNRSSDVNSVSVQKENKKASTYHTGSIYQNSNNEIENNQYREYTVNIRRPVGLADDTNNTSQNQINPTSETEKKKTNFDNKSMKNKKTKKKKKSARLPLVLMLTTLIFTVAICLSILIIAVGRDMLAIGKDDSLKMITITEGADAKSVAQTLADEKIIKIPKAFEIIAKMSGADTNFIPGEYELSPSDAYETILTKLTTDMSEYKETVDITFVEGISIFEAAQKLEEERVCDAERFLYYFNAGGYGFNFESKLPSSSASKFYRMEGYLFPDTYKFYVDSDPESVCMKIYQNFENKITEEYYNQMDKLGMTLDEVITLASIVQAEAASKDSMKMVASVFENRLADNFPKLESDPTTYYVDEIIKPNIEIPSEALFESYDTYQCNGLPSGAIGNPGLDAIEAVLYPADTNYYFFYANIDTKETYFAETNEELVQKQYEEAENENEDDEES